MDSTLMYNFTVYITYCLSILLLSGHSTVVAD